MSFTETYPVEVVEAVRRQIHSGWDAVMAEGTQQLAPPSDLGTLARTVLDVCGVPRLEGGELSQERLGTVQRLAEKLSASPSRIMDVRQLTEEGILCARLSGREVTAPSELAQRGGDKVAFTYGVPYVFLTASRAAYKDLDPLATSLVVLDEPAVAARPDLTIYGFDRGMLYIHNNPLRELTGRLWGEYPGLQPTPLDVLYEYVLADPERLNAFDEHMNRMLASHSIGPDQTSAYVAALLGYSLPLGRADGLTASQWRQTSAPEGNVDGSIPLEQVRAVITSDVYYSDTKQRLGGVEVVNAERVTPHGDYSRLGNRLLAAYAVVAEAPELIEVATKLEEKL